VATTLIAIAAAPLAHARGAGRRPAKAVAHASKKASARPSARPDGKVVLLPIRDDDDKSFTTQVERLLRARGVEVVTDVRGVDTPEQFRELATHLGIAAFVDGNLKEKEGAAISKVTIQVRSGWTGRKLTAVTFRETKPHLRAEVEDKLWPKIAPAISRACLDANKPRKRDRAPMMIEAGIPLNAPDPPPLAKAKPVPEPPAAKTKAAPTASAAFDPWGATTGGKF
jgi:NADPH:quinone reductase-like Zn-dependent oxidoreductase